VAALVAIGLQCAFSVAFAAGTADASGTVEKITVHGASLERALAGYSADRLPYGRTPKGGVMTGHLDLEPAIPRQTCRMSTCVR